MAAKQLTFPRDCTTNDACSTQNGEKGLRNTASVFPSSNYSPSTWTSNAMPIFGKFTGPPADSETHSQGDSLNLNEETSTSSPVVKFPGVNMSSVCMNIPNENTSEQLAPTEREHGPQTVPCPGSSASGISLDPRFLHPLERDNKSQYEDNADNARQDIASWGQQSAACSPLQTKTSPIVAEHNFFVPGPPGYEQRNTWLNHNVGSGSPQRLDCYDIDFYAAGPHQLALPRCDSYLQFLPPTPQLGSPGPAIAGPHYNMCQEYYKASMWEAPLMQLCSPSFASPSSTVFGFKSPPSTPTLLSTLFSLQSTPSTPHAPCFPSRYRVTVQPRMCPAVSADEQRRHPNFIEEELAGIAGLLPEAADLPVSPVALEEMWPIPTPGTREMFPLPAPGWRSAQQTPVVRMPAPEEQAPAKLEDEPKNNRAAVTTSAPSYAEVAGRLSSSDPPVPDNQQAPIMYVPGPEDFPERAPVAAPAAVNSFRPVSEMTYWERLDDYEHVTKSLQDSDSVSLGRQSHSIISSPRWNKLLAELVENSEPLPMEYRPSRWGAIGDGRPNVDVASNR